MFRHTELSQMGMTRQNPVSYLLGGIFVVPNRTSCFMSCALQVCPGLDTKSPEDLVWHCWPVGIAEGRAFELNNNLVHRVENNGTQPRIHLILDAGAARHTYTELRPGQTCRYEPPDVIC